MDSMDSTLPETSPAVKRRTWRLRARLPHWVPNEIRMAVGDMPWVLGGVGCVLEIAAEFAQPEPSWQLIRGIIWEATRRAPRHYGLNFRRLEARLAHLFTDRKREQAQ